MTGALVCFAAVCSHVPTQAVCEQMVLWLRALCAPLFPYMFDSLPRQVAPFHFFNTLRSRALFHVAAGRGIVHSEVRASGVESRDMPA